MGLPLNPTARLAIAIAFATVLVAASATNNRFDLKPFKIDLTGGIPRLKSLVNSTRLPAMAIYPDAGTDKGIELETLRELRTEWATTFDWEVQQAELNQLEHFTAVIEGQTVHFVHEKSKAVDAIPVILLHGWPGSFQEFLPVIEPLTQPSVSATGKTVSFNVVVPSLPGFVFSSAPPANWTVDDTARIFNTLMTEVLGYSTYAVHGTDWGSSVAYSLYSSFNTTVRAAHFIFLPFFPPAAQDIAENNITLSDIQKVTEKRSIDWNMTGNGYYIEQTTKPNDIGLALYDSPVGQLAWIGGKFKLWSDPRAGTPPSVLNNTAILTSVSLYYLTETFLSSVWIYAQNHNFFKTVYTNAPTDAPLLFSQYEYNVALWPEEYVAKVGNLVSYKVYDFGGHFPGLDNPPSVIEDIRDMAKYLLD
ncbi:Alpha/Beta hydrolase protein [Mycena albidolilacea]|uniref:Alpha/Beta hydrolase protein n=1 Tax=Mycena albidolilacea TaxID=1033008 RepID=A0AAD7EZT7_9AGAR|nr:Alpha/Beta hydrolase protein [Mycena albidolilacea]